MEFKRNLLWFFALVGMVVLGAGYTVTVGSLAEAQQEFEKPSIVDKGECEVLNVEQVMVGNYDANTPILVTYSLSYVIGEHEDRRIYQTSAEENEKASVENKVRIECDKTWVELKNTLKDNQKTVVIVTPGQVFDKIYDAVARTWKTKTGGIQIGD